MIKQCWLGRSPQFLFRKMTIYYLLSTKGDHICDKLANLVKHPQDLAKSKVVDMGLYKFMTGVDYSSYGLHWLEIMIRQYTEDTDAGEKIVLDIKRKCWHRGCLSDLKFILSSVWVNFKGDNFLIIQNFLKKNNGNPEMIFFKLKYLGNKNEKK